MTYSKRCYIFLESRQVTKFSENFDNPFSHVFIFGNMLPESYGFVAMPVTSRIKDKIMFQFIAI